MVRSLIEKMRSLAEQLDSKAVGIDGGGENLNDKQVASGIFNHADCMSSIFGL